MVLLVAFALGIVLGFWLAMAVVGASLVWLATRPLPTDLRNVTVPLWLDGREVARFRTELKH